MEFKFFLSFQKKTLTLFCKDKSPRQPSVKTLHSYPSFAPILPIARRNPPAALTIRLPILLLKLSLSYHLLMLKILQARLQQYVNCELPDVQAGFRKDRGTRDQIANIRWIIKKARVPEKHLFLHY